VARRTNARQERKRRRRDEGSGKERILKDDRGDDIILWNRDCLGGWSDDELERLLKDSDRRQTEARKDSRAVRAEQTRRKRSS
jgi:hypothetical protein